MGLQAANCESMSAVALPCQQTVFHDTPHPLVLRFFLIIFLCVTPVLEGVMEVYHVEMNTHSYHLD